MAVQPQKEEEVENKKRNIFTMNDELFAKFIREKREVIIAAISRSTIVNSYITWPIVDVIKDAKRRVN